MAGAFGGQGSALVCGGATEAYQNCSTSSWGKKVPKSLFKSVRYARPKKRIHQNTFKCKGEDKEYLFQGFLIVFLQILVNLFSESLSLDMKSLSLGQNHSIFMGKF